MMARARTGPGWSPGMAILTLACAATAAGAQPARSDIDQLGAQGESPIAQISSGSRDLIRPPRVVSDPSPPSQLSVADDAVPAPPQLTDERGAKPHRQLAPRGRTAAASEALSQPAEGRTGAIAKVEGEDRCDPAEEGADRRVCARVIETRAAEFARPPQGVLSAEQRLLIDQQLREGPADTRTAARRLGQTGFDPDSLEEQGIASVAIRGNAPTAPPDREDDATAIDPAVQAILGILNVPVPPQ